MGYPLLNKSSAIRLNPDNVYDRCSMYVYYERGEQCKMNSVSNRVHLLNYVNVSTYIRTAKLYKRDSSHRGKERFNSLDSGNETRLI